MSLKHWTTWSVGALMAAMLVAPTAAEAKTHYTGRARTAVASLHKHTGKTTKLVVHKKHKKHRKHKKTVSLKHRAKA